MHPERSLVVAVLAAGRSSRMGRPKPLVELDGERALARVLRLARERALAVRVVLGFHAQAVRAAIDLVDEEVVMNPRPELGMSSSVRAAARALAPDAALALWPVDHARVAATTFDRLLAAFRARAPATAIVAPSFAGRRGHPVLAAPEVVREWAALRDDEPAHAVVRRVPERVEHVVVDDRYVVEDFDVPADLTGPAGGGTGP